MKCIAVLVLLLGTAPCYGQITVSDRLPPPVKYPAEVFKMSDAEFFTWATDFNSRERAAVEGRRAKLVEKEWIEGTETRTTTNYLDYQGNYGGCGYSSCGNYSPNYGSSSQTTVQYPKRWKNPLYTGPGPLTIVNPYCRPAK